MKKLLTLLFLLSAIIVGAQSKKITLKKQVVEASCGQCQFKMEDKSCDLAIRIKGKPYFVDGTSIDEHGNAHAADGFCAAIRKAEVSGTIVNDRFVATAFKVMPEAKK